MQKAAPRLLIAGTNSGCGKTTVTCAILQALVDGGVSVAAAKCGPDYIDPMFHREIIGAKSSNLDPFFFDDDTLRFLLVQNGAGKDVTVIEGVMGYYDGIGAARHVIQNHLLQLMALTAMEEPVSFTAKDLTAEKTKVLSAVRLPKDLAANTARGQYAKGWQGSHEVVGYLEEKGIDPKSTTETYAAIRLDIDTRRWAGVPFYLRCGKRLGKRVTEIAVVFKRAPHLPFEQTAVRELGKNAIVIRVQPDEGVTMRFGAKVPGGSTMEVRDVNMDFSYGRSFTENSPEAYERLILDVLLGDPPLFPTTEEVNLSWEILDPIEQFWSTLGQPQAYRAGTWGPAQADEMLARDGRHWRMP